jgi:hypothetical protein
VSLPNEWVEDEGPENYRMEEIKTQKEKKMIGVGSPEQRKNGSKGRSFRVHSPRLPFKAKSW